jgi:preprotein translocase subunit SecY
MSAGSKGQVAMAMGSAILLVITIAIGALLFSGLKSTVEEIENEPYQLAKDVKMAAHSIGLPLLLLVIIVLVVVVILFLTSSIRAFG